MIRRKQHIDALLKRLRTFPVVAILGPRQIGKTTLARQVGREYPGPTHRLDLERPSDLNRLMDDPELVLDGLRGLVVIDEVQRRPDLFPILRVLADRRPRRARFLVLGSASPDLLRQSSESLAGRINYYRLGGLGLDEVGLDRLNRRWLRGGFPQAWLARSNPTAFLWLESFVRTFLERDLPELGIRVPGPALRRFWTMLAHWHGQVWNSSEFARSFGVADTTVRRYLDILTSALVVRQLQPWHENIAKRQVKAPKVYLRDTGVLHALLGIDSMQSLLRAGLPSLPLPSNTEAGRRQVARPCSRTRSRMRHGSSGDPGSAGRVSRMWRRNDGIGQWHIRAPSSWRTPAWSSAL